VKENKKEKMHHHLKYRLLDINDDNIPNDSINAFLMDLNEVKQYVQQEWHEYNGCTQHYKRLYKIVEVLEVLPGDHIAEYKKQDKVKKQQYKKQDEVEKQQEVESAARVTDKDERKGKAM